MRRFLFVIMFALTVLSTVGINSATAARYCLQGRAWGYPGDCHFSSYSQCMASASGKGAHSAITRPKHRRTG
jgi:Protein of unknown function (DUF3551)